MQTDSSPKRRKPWLAALLSFVTTGLGQVYNGQWQKGLLYFLGESVLGLLLLLGMGAFKTFVMGVGALLIVNVMVAGEAYVSARRLQGYTLQPCNRGWVYALVFLVNMVVGTGVEFVASGHLYETFKVPSGSMIPTLQVGDRFMASLLDDTTPLDRGQIVVFKFPEDRSKNFVKRVIGLPGDTVMIQDQVVTINGALLDETYARHTKEDSAPIRDNWGPYTIEPGQYFLMGDNREGSYDSRWFGPVNRSDIFALAEYVYFPGSIGNPEWAERFGKGLR